MSTHHQMLSNLQPN